jgi:hypothetical protein
MFTTDIDFFEDLDRACEAAARGDFSAAERWTGLAERKLAMMRRMCELAVKIGWKPEMMKYLAREGPAPGSPSCD